VHFGFEWLDRLLVPAGLRSAERSG
jgi:hypothetical protein